VGGGSLAVWRGPKALAQQKKINVKRGWKLAQNVHIENSPKIFHGPRL
jgi:hypothetical protein